MGEKSLIDEEGNRERFTYKRSERAFSGPGGGVLGSFDSESVQVNVMVKGICPC